MINLNNTIQGDALKVLKSLPDKNVNCCVTSPPYWGLRDYGVDGQLGLEENPEEYIEKMVEIFDQVRRVLRNDGTLWINMGDTYAGGGRRTYEDRENSLQATNKGSLLKSVKVPANLKPKDLIGVPWMVAFALRDAGWYLRCDIIWHKKQCMPESVQDRPTRNHEYIFLLSKSDKYYYDADAIKTDASPNTHARMARGRSANHKNVNGVPGQHPHSCMKPKRNARNGIDVKGGNQGSGGIPIVGKGQINKGGEGIKNNQSFNQAMVNIVSKVNKRTVWTTATESNSEAHFATYPQKLIEPCIKAGCPKGGVVLDPFHGSGTTGIVASKLGRNHLAIEIKPEYIEIEQRRREKELGIFKNEFYS